MALSLSYGCTISRFWTVGSSLYVGLLLAHIRSPRKCAKINGEICPRHVVCVNAHIAPAGVSNDRCPCCTSLYSSKEQNAYSRPSEGFVREKDPLGCIATHVCSV